MARKTKGKVQHNKRVRFCSLDYYKYLCITTKSNIEGIDNYYCTPSTIWIDYSSGKIVNYDVSRGEKQLKQVIKIINAYIGGTGDGAQQ